MARRGRPEPIQTELLSHPEIDVIQFASTENPAFPAEELERARRDLPAWKFSLFFEGVFSRIAGLIYDCFNRNHHVVPHFRIPQHWRRFCGIDFGGTNTAAVFLAEEQDGAQRPTGRYVAYREYKPEKRSVEAHVAALKADEPRLPTCAGGAASEDDWRDKFRQAGMPVARPAVREVEVGIDAVYALLANDNLLIMEDLSLLLDELASYSRVLDEKGEPTNEIEAKSSWHICDALRYCCIQIATAGPETWGQASKDSRTSVASAPRGVFQDEGRERGR